jgi:hypothetical protein
LIKFRDIRLDVQQRRAIENIDILDMQGVALYLLELDHRQPNGVRTLGRSGGKDSPGFRVQERDHL